MKKDQCTGNRKGQQQAKWKYAVKKLHWASFCFSSRWRKTLLKSNYFFNQGSRLGREPNCEPSEEN